jgi:hypothetical protein
LVQGLSLRRLARWLGLNAEDDDQLVLPAAGE